MPTAVVITGLEKAERDLGPERFGRVVRTGFEELGALTEEYTTAKIAPHHWHGELAGSLHAATTGSGALASERTEVTLRGPQVHSFRGGWFSRSGKQPPTEQIAAWLTERGRDPRFAFAVARQIGARSRGAAAGQSSGLAGAALGRLGGYSFGKLRLFPTARWIRTRAKAIFTRLLAEPAP